LLCLLVHECKANTLLVTKFLSTWKCWNKSINYLDYSVTVWRQKEHVTEIPDFIQITGATNQVFKHHWCKTVLDLVIRKGDEKRFEVLTAVLLQKHQKWHWWEVHVTNYQVINKIKSL
jgi:hypothetical protein